MATVFEVRDEVWEVVEPLLPAVEPQTTGRPRVPDRVAFNAIVFVLVTGIAWRFLPRELGCSGVTAWRRGGAIGRDAPSTGEADLVAVAFARSTTDTAPIADLG